MNIVNSEKLAGVVLSFSIAASFLGSSDVSASPVFPPAHIDDRAVFSPTDLATASIADPSWYRSGEQNGQVRAATFNSVSTVDLAINGPDVWYRATN